MKKEALSTEKDLVYSRIQLIDAEPVMSEWQPLADVGQSCIVFESHMPLSERKIFLEHLEFSPE